MKGYIGAVLELLLFLAGATYVRAQVPVFEDVPYLMYFWYCFTVLTGFWEFNYVTGYQSVVQMADKLVETKTHVWSSDYPVTMLLPNRLGQLFYAEYGAYADREYKSRRGGDFWARLIESSHALCCGAFCLLALVFYLHDSPERACLAGAMGMSAQFMNSLLYMGQYHLQTEDQDSPNYASPAFPLGPWLKQRPFMWINAFWMLFPSVICWQLLQIQNY